MNTHYEPEIRDTIHQGETWNVAWLARGPAGQILVASTGATSASTNANTIGWNIYDLQAGSEEVAVASMAAVSTSATNATNPDGGKYVLAASTSNGYSRTSAGHTVHLQIQPSAASWTQVPGRSYRLEVELGLNAAAGGGYQKLQAHVYVRPWFGTE